MEILSGRKIRIEVLNSLKKELVKLNSMPGLGIIEVGSTDFNVNLLKGIATDLNYKFKYITLPQKVDNDELISAINKLNSNTTIDGIFVKYNEGANINKSKVKNSINPIKDINCLTDINMGKLVNGRDGLYPCTALGIMELLRMYGINVINKKILIIGKDNYLRRSISNLIVHNNVALIECDKNNKDLSLLESIADIVILLDNEVDLTNIKNGSILIDCRKGLSEEDYTLIEPKLSYIAKKDSIEEMTNLEIFKNTYKAYVLRKNNKNIY